MSFTSCGLGGWWRRCQGRVRHTTTSSTKRSRELAATFFVSQGDAMSGKPTIRRLSGSPHLPFPRAVRVGDYVYTSSIYPIDDEGRIAEDKPWLGVAGSALIAGQARHCLTTLKNTLVELQSSLSLVVKVDVHL